MPYFRLFAGLMASCILATPAAASEPAVPGPDLTAREVVDIQLRALSDNDDPVPDAGIEQVWAFAHPDNRAVTGPLPRFKRMIKGRGYGVLINHSRAEVEALGEGPNRAVYRVRVVARDGGFHRFRWQLEKASLDAGEAWMTTGVTPGRDTGEKML
ncbi:DUF4864 domain-containing protein [Spiribacter vilamensis]|uniref:Uncharacterized protein DUF4864 n=1 Tax=Spiribacter vilamensis TaxID=531306 RepID=A0A4Q8D2C9_9GAMM|nr:DUF4864 domain-containing protein [Spiribacter vilamensis]RZU99546.1 uncharacterized protein DUF4864 [Spiribacter vilamensis]TVO61484.1 DUF4864 domain-containing protein [Spiribacter vilamensis]